MFTQTNEPAFYDASSSSSSSSVSPPPPEMCTESEDPLETRPTERAKARDDSEWGFVNAGRIDDQSDDQLPVRVPPTKRTFAMICATKSQRYPHSRRRSLPSVVSPAMGHASSSIKEKSSLFFTHRQRREERNNPTEDLNQPFHFSSYRDDPSDPRRITDSLDDADDGEESQNGPRVSLPRRLIRTRSEPIQSRRIRSGASPAAIRRWVESENATSTTDILGSLYNYMKISEMSKYGIDVFESILETYLGLLDESDVITLVTSYWCNGIHFQCMVRKRGSVLKNGDRLILEMTDSLLDAAITGGSTVHKIQCMLKQRRSDFVQNGSKRTGNGLIKIAQKKDTEFFERNCQYRLWNHEVLVKSFIGNGWLTTSLANTGINRFASNIFDRTMIHFEAKSKMSVTSQIRSVMTGMTTGDIVSSEVVPLHRQLVVERREVKGDLERSDERGNGGNTGMNHLKGFPVSSKVILRWMVLVELLGSRGGIKIDPNRFIKIESVHRAFHRGKNTWTFISASNELKNEWLWEACQMRLPAEMWGSVVDCL